MSSIPGNSKRFHLLTVACERAYEVHLALQVDKDVPADLTLCGLPVTDTHAAGAFLSLGCRECAELAADSGSHVAVDDKGAAVNVASFLRQRRSEP